ELGLGPEEIAYIGDDLNDLPAFAEVGLTAAPADAPLEVKNQAFMVTEARGGQGCVREFLEAILRARGDWEKVLLGRGLTPGGAMREPPPGRTPLAGIGGARAGRAWAAARRRGDLRDRPGFRMSPHYTQGLHYLASGQLELAITELTKVAREDPEAV